MRTWSLPLEIDLHAAKRTRKPKAALLALRYRRAMVEARDWLDQNAPGRARETLTEALKDL